MIQNQNRGIFVNGKNQVMEMLKYMTPQHKENILNHIRLKNPSLADELTLGCLDFSLLEKLDDNDIRRIFTHVDPVVFGLAIRPVNRSLQKHLLSRASRDYAEVAYESMTKVLKNEASLISKAQRKTMEVLTLLIRRQIIKLKIM